MTGPRNLIVAAAALLVPLVPAHAGLILSELIIDLESGKHARQDIEIWNDSLERTYVAADPSEILDPGTPGERRRREPDPERLGLLVSPARMILEPGQRKLLRVAAIAPDSRTERVYRVTTKPVAGRLSADASGLKIMVGYDVLVLVRPAEKRADIVGIRSGDALTLRNVGNVSVELIQGRQCSRVAEECSDLPPKRLYAGTAWTVPVKGNLAVEYVVRSVTGDVRRRF